MAKASDDLVSQVLRSVSGRDAARQVRRASELDVKRAHLPTGIFGLDLGLHGGWAMSAINLAVGRRSAGKSEAMWRAVRSAQDLVPDRVPALVITEPDFDLTHGVVNFGVDPERLILTTPESGEKAAGFFEDFVRNPQVSFLALDSLPAMVPESEIDTGPGEKEQAKSYDEAMQPGSIATLVKRVLMRSQQAFTEHLNEGRIGPAVLLINQWRDGAPGSNSKYPVKRMPCGTYFEYACYAQVDFANKEFVGSTAVGNQHVKRTDHTWQVIKAKSGNSERSGEFSVIRDPAHPLGMCAVDEAKTILAYAKLNGLYTGGGASWRIAGVEETFGKVEEAMDFLRTHPAESAALQKAVISANRARFKKTPDGWHVEDVLASLAA